MAFILHFFNSKSSSIQACQALVFVQFQWCYGLSFVLYKLKLKPSKLKLKLMFPVNLKFLLIHETQLCDKLIFKSKLKRFIFVTFFSRLPFEAYTLQWPTILYQSTNC